MSDTDSRPPSDHDAHTVYGARPAAGGRRKRWIFIVLGVVVVALVLWIIYVTTTPATQAGPGGAGAAASGGRGGRSGGRGGRGGAGGLPTAVNAAKATQGDIPVFLNELGTATPPATVTVIPQISGQLLSVGFHEGQMVKKGQFLAQIDPRPYQQMLLNAQATQAKDQASLTDAQLDLKRYQTLLKQDSIASQQVDTQAATVRQDEAQVKADAANVAQQKLNLIYCHITSPVTGRVGLRQVDPGNYVTAGTTNGLVVVTVIDPMDVLFTIPEDNLPAVTARMRAGAVLPAAALDRSQTTQLAMGKLFTLDNQVDTTTGTIRAKARFDNGNGALFPNQFVNIRLTVDTLHNVVIVPTSAILKGPNGMFVYTVEQTRAGHRHKRQGRPGGGREHRHPFWSRRRRRGGDRWVRPPERRGAGDAARRLHPGRRARRLWPTWRCRSRRRGCGRRQAEDHGRLLRPLRQAGARSDGGNALQARPASKLAAQQRRRRSQSVRPQLRRRAWRARSGGDLDINANGYNHHLENGHKDHNRDCARGPKSGQPRDRCTASRASSRCRQRRWWSRRRTWQPHAGDARSPEP